ncbi:molybdate transport repressor ModE|uniref:Molybdate transport repressor ModE n=1 Tax=Brenneria salicis ATCC 15712 = DSM 30166 TaxID=714314 RepID=A0A366IDL3_9GAMM|nr:molybdenum-dependent transcriptional regulator [Brenneria salicis]NMN92175.1 molybdate transport repressor ModE [Brenneria salicis ATCC 15712 = DSM 30166]RBP67509.1 molybdate transport repressor ModE [Brenneria salicis ATCC 15712 = DSM 30166]RLM32504.1 molybdenum-dependent transcriptional regulator [Brenneria salicis ATCC 15712 = DSM 30166]
MQAEILLTLKLQQRLFADPRRIELLKQIRHTGSISQGAKLARISYKSAWDAINEMNQLAEQTVVERMTGGKGGGGAQITRYGERLLQLYDLLAQIQQKAFDVLQQEDLPLDSLLAAIARFSLQTSARNQFFGTVLACGDQAVQQQLNILLADGKTTVSALITRQSAERLRLEAGKEVLVLIKAPWVDIYAADAPMPPADNTLRGQISSLETGPESSEVLIALAGSETLCATVPNDIVAARRLQPGIKVSASFNADQVIVATLC